MGPVGGRVSGRVDPTGPETGVTKGAWGRIPVTPGSYFRGMTTLRPAPTWIESPTDEYLRLERERVMLEARQAELLGEIDAAEAFLDEGLTSTTALLRHRVGVSAGEAARRVADARGLRAQSEVAEAFATARIDLPRVRMLLEAASVSAPLFARDRTLLIDTVAGLGTGHARRAVSYWIQAADRHAADADARHLHDRRHLHVSPTLGGMVRIDGELDPDGGQVVLTALRSLTDPAGLDPNDTRCQAQRRADALVDLCADHLAHGDAPVTGQTRPQVSVIVSTHALAGHSADPCEFDDGTVITPRAARRVACDATVTRVVMGPGSQVVDVGRATRTIPPATRTALVARDRHCRRPGCERPARWCDAHHVIHWADGGRTDLDNPSIG